MLNIKKPELLAPAGNIEILKIAIKYGADAVYIGGEAFGLRAAAHNFDKNSMQEGIAFAHKHNKKVFVTANILAHNYDLSGVKEYFLELKEIKPDAVIVADPGIFEIARETIEEIPIHISTQSNNINYQTFKFWKRMGAERVVTGRELSLREIKEIRENVKDVEIETFVHGAMCMSYSGRCLLSNYMTDRDANAGACTHPCRWKYSLVEEKRPDEYFPVYENERGTFIFNSKDLCMIEHIDKLLEAGIDSFKIEGRMKTALYVASTVRAYRLAIDEFFENRDLYESRKEFYLKEVESASRRKFTTGFFFGKADESSMYYEAERTAKSVYLGMIEAVEKLENGNFVGSIEQKNKFNVFDEIEVIKPSGENIFVKVLSIKDEKGREQESCPHPKQRLFVEFDGEVEEFDILRRDASN